MIEKFHIYGSFNDYATIQEPDKHEDERKQLIGKGYQPWRRYVIDGKQAELLVNTPDMRQPSCEAQILTRILVK